MRRAGTMTKGAALAALMMLATAGPAAAHAEFETATVPADSAQELGLHVPGERPNAHNVKVVVELPAGFELHSCDVGAGWSCSAEPAVGDQPARVTFTLQEGAEGGHTMAVPTHGGDEPAPPAPPAHDEPAPASGEEADMFHFGVHTPAEAGDYSFAVDQEYSDGRTMHWSGDAASNEPAPVVTVEAPA
jgi:uncharacterized protein YcnI